MTGPHDGGAGQVPFGDEVQRLLGAVQEWAQRVVPAPPSGHPGPECQWCPLCQLASVLRGEHPEMAERLAETGSAVAAAVRALLDTATRHVPATRAPGATEGSRRPAPAPRVQHIDLRGPGE